MNAARTGGHVKGVAPDFAEFYAAHHRGLVAQLYAMTGRLDEAEEVAQEAFLRALPRWGSIAEYEDPRAWVLTVAMRVAVSRWRRARVAMRHSRAEREPLHEPPDPSSVALVAALRQLPEAQRRALVLHHMADWSIVAIAAHEGVAEGTVKARLSRGRTALGALLTGETDDPPERVPAGPALAGAAIPPAATDRPRTPASVPPAPGLRDRGEFRAD